MSPEQVQVAGLLCGLVLEAHSFADRLLKRLHCFDEIAWLMSQETWRNLAKGYTRYLYEAGLEEVIRSKATFDGIVDLVSWVFGEANW